MNTRVQARRGWKQGRTGPACRLSGFTLLELLAAIAIITIIASLMLPTLAKAKVRSQRVACSNHLRVLGVALNGYASEHDDRYPMSLLPGLDREVLPGLPGTRPGAGFVLSPRPFQALSNDISSTKVLVCPAERRTAPMSFAALHTSHLSYALSLAARPGEVQSPVATDRNLTNAPATTARPAGSSDDIRLSWTRAMHNQAGHVLLGDGHVEFWRNFRIPPDPSGAGQGGGIARASSPRQAGSGQPSQAGASEPPQAGTRRDTSGGIPRGGSREAQRAGEAPQALLPGRAPEKGATVLSNAAPATVEEAQAVGEPAEDATLAPVVSAFKWAYLLCVLWALLVLLAYYLRHRERARRRRASA